METRLTLERDKQLQLLRDGLAHQTYPGYPESRFCLPFKLLGKHDGRIVIPEGSWTTSLECPDIEEQNELIKRSCELDSLGRPIHPWLEAMVSDPSIGIVTGKGCYWNWGPNRTVDPAVVYNEQLLMVRRKDTGLWALPGGFIDKAETAENAATREVLEETGIEIDREPKSVLYQGPVADLRLTANAWPETTCLLYEPEDLPDTNPKGMDDASEASWIPLDHARQMLNLFGSHRIFVDLVLKQCGVCY